MEYVNFINTLMRCQTRSIKAIPFHSSCAPAQIPDEFSALLPNLVELLEGSIDLFCKTDQVLVLFGLQPSSIALTSELPISLQRVIDGSSPNMHLCCSLAYLTATEQRLKNIHSWEGAQNIIVDFTLGTVMNDERYIAQVLGEPPRGLVYGSLNKTSLSFAWEKIKQRYKTQTS